MPKYVAGKDLKSNQERMFNSTDSDYMNKQSVVKKVIGCIHGEHRGRQLEKAFGKINIDEVIMLGMLLESAIEKEVETRLDFEQKDAT
jgi:hypothetical protein